MTDHDDKRVITFSISHFWLPELSAFLKFLIHSLCTSNTRNKTSHYEQPIISNNWVTLTAAHRKFYWQLKTVWTVILNNKTYIIISHNHTSETGVESTSAHLCDILWFSEVCRCRHGNSNIWDRTFVVSQKVTESVPQSFTLVYTVSFNATFLDVNFRGTNALKLCTMIH